MTSTPSTKTYRGTMKKNYKYKHSISHRHDWVWWAYLVLLCVALMLCLYSCKRVEYVTAEKVVYKTDTLRQTLVQRDSIYLHDSIAYKEFVKGDTVRIESEKWHTKYIDRWRHDTIYVSKVDSVRVPKPYPVVEVKEVPRKKKWWEITLEWVGIIALLSISLYVASKVRK